MNLTSEQLKHIMPNALSSNITKYLPYLNELMPMFGINTRLRIQHFIAQIAHESGSFRYNQEIASGKAYDTGKLAAALGNTPQADGDGQKYKGRGLMQLTGTYNYRAFTKFVHDKLGETDVDFLKTPERLTEPRFSVMSACYIFQKAGCLVLADNDDVTKVTKKINGGTNGLDKRIQFLKRCKEVI